jgi:hypothetical protein
LLLDEPHRLTPDFGFVYDGEMNEPIQPASDDPETESDRRNTNIFLAAMFLVLLGIGYWLVDALVVQRDLDNCLSQGRRNCAPLANPAR